MVMMVGVGVEAVGVVVVVVVVVVVGGRGEGDAAGAASGDASSVVSTGGGSVPFFMFPEAEPRTTKMTATLCDLIQLRDVAWTERPSCLTHPRPHGWKRQVRVRDGTAGLRWRVLDMQAGAGRGWGGRCSGSYIESGKLSRGARHRASPNGWGRCRAWCKCTSSTVLEESNLGPSCRPPPPSRAGPGFCLRALTKGGGAP